MGTARIAVMHGKKRACFAGFERICRPQTCTLGATP
jgi:hypothetical protein